MFSNTSTTEKERTTFIKEATIMARLRHPNVVALMGVILTPKLAIVSEYMSRGNVSDLLADKNRVVELEHVRRIALDTARGMTYLHASNVLHRDLKSRNLLIDKHWNVKVADFGLSRGLADPGVSMTMTACGTPSHVAPEVIRRQHYSFKADVYSFAICLWEMVTRKAPFSDISPYQVIVAVASNGARPPLSRDSADPYLYDLIVACWNEDPDRRPSFQQVSHRLQVIKYPKPTKKVPYSLTKQSTQSQIILNSTNATDNALGENTPNSPATTPGMHSNSPETNSLTKAPTKKQ